jgi:hypothetical protein
MPGSALLGFRPSMSADFPSIGHFVLREPERSLTVSPDRPGGAAMTAAFVALPMMLLLAAVVFTPSERPAARLVKIIRAWRRR